ncbi:MAG TPA: helix-turn-helix domain-containing protein [Crinalium sp.]|jgi:hypothetical protein
MCPEFPNLSPDSPSDAFANEDVDTPSASQIDTLNLTDALQDIVRWMARQKTVTAIEIATHFQQDVPTVQVMMDALVEQGLVQRLSDENAVEPSTLCRYQLHLGSKRGRQASPGIWNDLGA